MSRYDWLLFLHVIAAFATVASVVVFAGLLGATWRVSAPGDAMPLLRLSRLAEMLWNVGGAGVLILGVWLAVDVDGYGLADGWIVAAFVLWVVAGASGGMVGRGYRDALAGGRAGGTATLASTIRSSRSLLLHGVMAVAVAALLVVMIWKPGAA